jgi:peptide/nickel transport system permease protein
MYRFAGKRILYAIPLLFAISLLAFFLLQAVPGGPAAAYQGIANVSGDDLARIESELGLDRPLIVQYFSWLGSFLRGDWGVSFSARQPVLELVMDRLPATLILMGAALTVSLVIAIPLGMIAALRRNTWIDHLLTFQSFVGLSIPVFWLGLMLIIVFTVWLGWLPGGGIGPPGEDPDLVTRLRYMILPVTALSLVSIGFFTRYLRASMVEVMHKDFMMFSKARGISSRKRYFRNGFRNAGIPFITVVAIHIPEYLVGALVVETIFSWPGTGRLFWESAVRFDYPVMMGILVLVSVLVVFSNLLADLLYARFDPRIRYD